LTLDKISQKKELGQFFSGKMVAKLLVALSNSDDVRTVIDPMCGIGDMLLQFNSTSNPVTSISGIEIDPLIFDELKIRMATSRSKNLIVGNAFDNSIIKKMLPEGYDLVITNPPYVRYQTVNQFEKQYSSALGMKEIQANLIQSLQHFTTVGEHDKQLLKLIIRNISGFSDLAVPSWILCSLLVKDGGRLAIVVPETWLNRDYAQIVKYLLLQWFQIEYIVEDANSSWFSPAQVKTILLVAKRIPAKNSITTWHKEHFKYIQLYKNAQSDNSLVGNIFPKSNYPEKEFIRIIEDKISNNANWQSRNIQIIDFANELLSAIETKKWYKELHNEAGNTDRTPKRLKPSSNLLEWCDDDKTKFSQFLDLGVSVSQGLRTGANNFFYLMAKDEGNGLITAYPNPITGVRPFLIEKRFFRDIIRKQSELPDKFALSSSDSVSVVLSAQKYALPEDIAYTVKFNKEFKGMYQEVPEPLANYIRIVSRLKNGFRPNDNLIPELSAVKTNVRVWNKNKPEIIPRFWYMLPEFSKRHYPDLFIPRVNGGSVKTRMNSNCKYLIDANFSTIWISDSNSIYDNFALLALLNSTWAVIAMEEYGTVMGGGALKLEATQLKQIPFPNLDIMSIKKLSKLGEKLSVATLTSCDVISSIDVVIISALGFTSNIHHKLDELRQIKENLLKKRISKWTTLL